MRFTDTNAFAVAAREYGMAPRELRAELEARGVDADAFEDQLMDGRADMADLDAILDTW